MRKTISHLNPFDDRVGSLRSTTGCANDSSDGTPNGCFN